MRVHQKQNVILVNYSLAVDGMCEKNGMGIKAKHPGLQVMMTIFNEMVHKLLSREAHVVSTWEEVLFLHKKSEKKPCYTGTN